jgi:hypothetical protein
MTGGSIDALDNVTRAPHGPDIERSRRSASNGVMFSPDGCGPCLAQLDESSHCNLHDRPRPTGGSLPGSLRSGTGAQAPGSLPKSVHIVPVIICVDDGGSLPITRAPCELSTEPTTRMTGATTCRRSRHSGVRTETCAPTRHPSAPWDTWTTRPLTRRQDARHLRARARRRTRRRPDGPPSARRSSDSVPAPCST